NEETGWSDGFDVVLGNPPYGADQNKRERAMLNVRDSIGRATANSAADFLLLARNLIRPLGLVGLVVPKSLSYSSSWDAVRAELSHAVSSVIDVSQAWDDVLLEQILVSYRRPDLPVAASLTVSLGRMLKSGELTFGARESAL